MMTMAEDVHQATGSVERVSSRSEKSSSLVASQTRTRKSAGATSESGAIDSLVRLC